MHPPPVTCSPTLSEKKSSDSSPAPNKHGKTPGTDASPVHISPITMPAPPLFPSKCPSDSDHRRPSGRGRNSVNASGGNRGTCCGCWSLDHVSVVRINVLLIPSCLEETVCCSVFTLSLQLRTSFANGAMQSEGKTRAGQPASPIGSCLSSPFAGSVWFLKTRFARRRLRSAF